MDDHLAKTIGSAARSGRLARGLTQEDAADAVGVSIEFYARIERGKTLPSVPTLLRLAAALRVSADVLLGLDRLSDAARDRVASPDPPVAVATRRIMRRLRQARPSTMRLVALLLREVETGSRRTRRG